MDLETGNTRHKLYRTYCSGAEAPGQHLSVNQRTAFAGTEREINVLIAFIQCSLEQNRDSSPKKLNSVII